MNKEIINKIKEFIKKNGQEIIHDVQHLVRINTTLDTNSITSNHPNGKYIRRGFSELKKYVQKYKELKSYTFGNSHDFSFFDYKNNSSEKNKLILFACHLDTVGFGKSKLWFHENPLSGELHNDSIYGRGSVDDKGSIVMIVWLMRCLEALKINLPFNLRCFVGGDEEISGSSHNTYLSSYKIPNLTIVPDGEFPISYGEKSIYNYEIRIQDKFTIIKSITATNIINMVPGHCEAVIKMNSKTINKNFELYIYENKLSGTIEDIGPDLCRIHIEGHSQHAIHAIKGINAITHMFNFVASYCPLNKSKIEKYIQYFLFNDHYGNNFEINAFSPEFESETNLNFGCIDLLEDNIFSLKLNIRFLSNVISSKEVQDKITSLSEKFLSNDFDFQFKCLRASDGFSRNIHSGIWKLILDSYRLVSNDYKSIPIYSSGGSYARNFPNSINMGPVLATQEYKAHCINEKLYLTTLFDAIIYYVFIIYTLSNNEKLL